MTEKSETLKKFNRVMIYVVIFLGIFLVVAFAGVTTTTGKVFFSPSSGDKPSASLRSGLCALSPDFCDCQPSRWCVNDYKYGSKSSSCRVSYGNCASGQICSKGFCQGNSTPTCTDECSGNAQCYGSNSYRLCGNYDADSCKELSNTINNCPGGQVCQINGGVAQCVTPTNPDNCTDTDGGYTLGVRGTLNIFVNGTNTTITDFCSGNVLTEYYCSGSGGSYSSGTFNCVNASLGFNSCVNGACTNNQTNPTKPDLKVSTVWHINTVTNTTFWAIINNTGNAPAGSSYTRFIIYNPIHSWRDVYTPSIASGQVVYISTNFTRYTFNLTMNVTTDIHNNISESNETNNNYRYTGYIYP